MAVQVANLDCAKTDTEAGRVAGKRMAQFVQGKPVVCEIEGRQTFDCELGTCALASTGGDVGEVLIVEDVCELWELLRALTASSADASEPALGERPFATLRSLGPLFRGTIEIVTKDKSAH